MFKSIVTKLAKNAWDSVGAEPDQTASAFQHSVGSGHDVEAPVESVADDADTSGIEFPYYPRVDTACGDACRCRWSVEVRWSDEYRANATFATWKSAEDNVCPDCQWRAQEWQDVLIRVEQQ